MNYSLVRACPQAEAYVERERERERETSTVTVEWQGKKQCDSYFSQSRGGESRVRDVMPQSRFSVTKKFQHAHMPPEFDG